MAINEACDKYKKVLSEDEWRQIVTKKLQTTNFKIVQTSISPLSEDQVGFMGDHLKLEASVEITDQKDGSIRKEDLHFFGKTVPVGNQAFKDYVDGTRSFCKEFYFFSSLISDLKNYYVNNGQQSSWTCECYLARLDMVVLENLVVQGYQQHDTRSAMDYDHCVIVLKTLASFHAASVIFEENQSKTFSGSTRKLTDIYPDIFFETEWVTTEGHPGNGLLVSTIRAALNFLKYLPGYENNSEKFKIVREKLPEMLMNLCEYVKPSRIYRNVLTHGDPWTSNMFFRYETDNVPVEARFVDFQLYRYNPPAADVMCFLCLVTTREFRETNLERLLTTYYENFSAELRRHGLDPDQLELSWSEFKASCDFYIKVGRVTAAVYKQQTAMKGDVLKTVFSNPQDMHMFMRVDKTKYVIDNILSDPYYRDENVNAMEELIERCILVK